jgi:hypothetical protein
MQYANYYALEKPLITRGKRDQWTLVDFSTKIVWISVTVLQDMEHTIRLRLHQKPPNESAQAIPRELPNPAVVSA